VQFKIHGTVWQTPVFCFAPSLLQPYKYEAIQKERRRETSTGTPAGTKRNQQIMMEQNPFPEERREKKGDKHRNPRPKQEEPGNP